VPAGLRRRSRGGRATTPAAGVDAISNGVRCNARPRSRSVTWSAMCACRTARGTIAARTCVAPRARPACPPLDAAERLPARPASTWERAGGPVGTFRRGERRLPRLPPRSPSKYSTTPEGPCISSRPRPNRRASTSPCGPAARSGGSRSPRTTIAFALVPRRDRPPAVTVGRRPAARVASSRADGRPSPGRGRRKWGCGGSAASRLPQAAW
jgi:hypothetical protein